MEENEVILEQTEEALEEVAEEAQETEAEESQEAGEQETDPKQSKQDEWSKTAKNAISYRDKKIHKLKSRYEEVNSVNQELLKRLSDIEAKLNQADDGRPKQDDFDTWEAYNEATIDWKVEQREKQRQQKDLEAQNEGIQKAQANDFYEERTQELREIADQYAAKIPDYAVTMAANADFFDALPESHADLFYQATEAAGAAYILAKEGKIERLAKMRPELVAAEILRAEDKFHNLSKQQVTKAPTPLQAAKGTGGSINKTIHQMSTAELMEKYYNNRN